MPVNTPCNEYTKFISKWIKCRTVAAGEEAVKAAGMIYLPRLKDQVQGEYNAYKERALFYGATGRTVTGLLGAIFRKPITMDGMESPKYEEQFQSVTQDAQDYVDFASTIVSEVIITGRVGILLDAPKIEENENEKISNSDAVAYLAIYQAENIINWRYKNSPRGLVLSMVVLEEEYEASGDDEFENENKKQYRVLELKDEIYQQRLFRKAPMNSLNLNDRGKWEYVEVYKEPVVPQVSGAVLDYIPFMFINPVDTGPMIYDSPILALSNVNLSHYRSSADLEHGRHFTGLPTAWVAGFDTDKTLHIGSQVAWVSEDPQANAGFLEFTGQGLQSLENALKEKQNMMAVLGARMLEEPKNPVESGVAISTRIRGENNVLSSISRTVSRALTIMYTWLMEWRGFAQEITVELNKDFINDRLAPADIKSLMESWQGGAISWETLYFNYKRGEIYPADINMDEEKMRMENEVEIDVKSLTTPELEKGGEVKGELENEEEPKGEARPVK